MPISVRGLNEATEENEGRAERCRNLGPVLQVKAQDLHSLIDDSFDGSKSPMGGVWQPLSPTTIKRRRRGSSKPLVDTGRLRNSNTTRAKPRSIEFGSNVNYASAQQFGTEHIPARPFLPVLPSGEFANAGPSAAWLRETEEAIANYIETGELPR